ncbi:hypothetical protein C8R45DRAFT_612956 [Mycena sanguinolenta]|nr:hypothetical protein C8R45DRAFT_612956 [Mycena sanguinolenta]
MDDGKRDSLRAGLLADHTVLVATTLATLFLAGSAFICRSGIRLSTPKSHSLVTGTSQADSEDKKQIAESSAKNNTRSKERRRRGKDPLKDILRSGKKLKMLTVSRDTGSSAAVPEAFSPQISESGNTYSGSHRSASVSTPSTSRSPSSVGSSHNSSAAAEAFRMTDIHPRDSEVAGTLLPASSIKKPQKRDVSWMPESSIMSDSLANKSSTVPLMPSSPSAYNPWDWDGQSLSTSTIAGEPAPYRKPPRFLSKSSFISSSSSTPPRPSASSVASSDDLAFPTLSASTSGTPRRVPTPRTSSSSNSNSGGNTGRASPGSGTSEGPLSTQTQLASLRGALEAARIREEKARVELDRYTKDVEMMRWENSAWSRREAELQAHVHHLLYQLQAYAAFFHAQAHRQHTQNESPDPGSPSSLPNGYSGAQSPVGPAVYACFPSPNGYPLPGALSPNGYPPPGIFSPPLSPDQPQQPYVGYPMPPSPSVPTHQQQQQQPTLFSMLFPGAVSAKGGSEGSANGSAAGNARGAGSAKGSGSVSGSSVGSDSGLSDLVGLPALATDSSLMDRGRRRTRTQTAEARLGLEMGDSWVGVEHEAAEVVENEEAPKQSDYQEEEGECNGYKDDETLSDVLADAIFKRPESIRVRSRQKQSLPPAEFTFPSLSDFGPGSQQGGEHMEKHPRDGGVGDSDAGAVQQEVDAGANEDRILQVPVENSDATSNSNDNSELKC